VLPAASFGGGFVILIILPYWKTITNSYFPAKIAHSSCLISFSVKASRRYSAISLQSSSADIKQSLCKTDDIQRLIYDFFFEILSWIVFDMFGFEIYVKILLLKYVFFIANTFLDQLWDFVTLFSSFLEMKLYITATK